MVVLVKYIRQPVSYHKEDTIMGKIARSTAHVKNVTLDPTVKVGSFVGRKTKAGASKVRSCFRNGITAVKEAEADIEREKAAKAKAEALLAEATATTEDAPTVTPKPASQTKKAKAATKKTAPANA